MFEKAIAFSDSISPICMLEYQQVTRETEGVIVGYGQSEDETKPHETIPRSLDVMIVNNADCFFSNSELVQISSNRTFCAGTHFGAGACRGNK